MKILIVNPNTTYAFTEAIEKTAVQVKSDDTEVICANPAAGPSAIESDYDELLSVAPCLDVVLPHRGDFDALVVACYGNHPPYLRGERSAETTCNRHHGGIAPFGLYGRRAL